MTRDDLTDAYTKDVCRIGQGAACCRYITMGAGGWNCVKHDLRLKDYLDHRVATGAMKAHGDNCEGVDGNLSATIVRLTSLTTGEEIDTSETPEACDPDFIMPQGIDPTEADIGRRVIYRHGQFPPETGVITSFTPMYVHVRYGAENGSKATLRSQLDWEIDTSEIPEQGEEFFARAKLRDDAGLYLIWSEEHQAWWGPARMGYTTSIREAGRYLQSAVASILRDANFGTQFNEIAIPCPPGIPPKEEK